MEFLIGEKVYLRPVCKNDIGFFLKCSNDPEIRRLIGRVTPLSEFEAQDYVEGLIKDKNRIWFMIVLKEDDKVIGETGLLRMFHPWRTTDLSIFIGEKEYWGKGYGTDTIYLLMDYAFGYMNFHRISIGVVGFNYKALKFYEKVGFKTEGIQRDGYYFDHKYSDFIMMSILEDEFRNLYKKK